MPSSDEVKAQARVRFGRFAQEYIESPSHAAGADLERLVELVAPQAEWLALDMATGGAHTALKFAAHIRHVIAVDVTPNMLDAARRFTQEQNAPNIIFVAADAEQIAFADGVFDLVTCRIAPHHFPDAFRFVQECKRVLKPGGLLLVEDHLLPDDERAARYIDSFERLRDPSHHRAFAGYEWQGMFLDAGLTVEHVESLIKQDVKLLPWAARQGSPPAVIERLQVMLAQAPAAVSAWMNPKAAGSPDAAFDHHYLIILGQKP